MSLYAAELEKHFISGIFHNPSIYYDVDGIISERDFSCSDYNTVFCILRNLILSEEKFDKVLLAQKIKNLGIPLTNNMNPFDLVDAIVFNKVNADAIQKIAKELVKFRKLREIFECGSNLQKLAQSSSELPLDDVLAKTQDLFDQGISISDLEDEIEYIYEKLENFIEERGNNPVEDSGLLSGFYEYDRMYGSFRDGNLYSFVSRSSEGKTTLLHDLIYGICKKNPNVEALYLDTEMDSSETKIRAACARTGVGFWYLDNGMWRKNQELLERTREGLKSAGKPRIAYVRVGNKNVDQICSLARRWKLSKVRPGARTILCYDYIKLTGEKIGGNWAEYQAIGEKVDKLKKLAEFLKSPLLTAMQLNRTGDNFGKTRDSVLDDSTTIAVSDRMLWFASGVSIFRRKTLDEIALDGQQFGTHKLITIKARFQGKESAGHSDFMRRPFPDGTEKYVRNYINFKVDNFLVTECGSVKHCIQSFLEKVNLKDEVRDKKEGDIM